MKDIDKMSSNELRAEVRVLRVENEIIKAEFKETLSCRHARIDALTAEVTRLREALHPGKKACDCCERTEYKGESFWAIDCQCGNHDDIGQAQAWCSRANAYEGATGSQVEALDENRETTDG